MKYNAVFIAGDATVVLTEQAVASTEWIIEVRLNGRSIGSASLIRSYFPRVAVGSDKVFIWGGTRLYWAATKGGEMRRVYVDDEVHRAYPLDSDWWCLVGETSVSLWNESDGVIATASHNEVLVDAWRQARQLYVQDFQQRVFTVLVDCNVRAVTLVPMNEDSAIRR